MHEFFFFFFDLMLFICIGFQENSNKKMGIPAREIPERVQTSANGDSKEEMRAECVPAVSRGFR